MKHEVKKELVIKLELTLGEFEHLLSASSVDDNLHKETHSQILEGEYNGDLAFEIAKQLDKIYESIK